LHIEQQNGLQPNLLVQSPDRFALEIVDGGIAAWYDLRRDPLRQNNLVADGAFLLEHRTADGELLRLTEPEVLEDTVVRSRIAWRGINPNTGSTQAIEYTIWAGGQIVVSMPDNVGLQTTLNRDSAAITGAALSTQENEGSTQAALVFLDSWSADSSLPAAETAEANETTDEAAAAPSYDAQTGAFVTTVANSDTTVVTVPPGVALRQPRFEFAGWTSPEVTIQRGETVLVAGQDYLAAWNEPDETLTVQYLHPLPASTDGAAQTFNFSQAASATAISLAIPGKTLDENGMLLIDGNMPDNDGQMSSKDLFTIPYIQARPDLNVTASIQDAPAGAKVEFVLTQSDATQQVVVDDVAPYEASFTMTIPGEHRLDAYVQDSSGNRINGAADSIDPVGYGNIVVSIGDSITAGVGGNGVEGPVTSYLDSPEASADNRNIYQYDNYDFEDTLFLRGYQLKLNNNLTQCSNAPVFILNDGFGGIRTARSDDLNLLEKQAYYNDHIDKLGAPYVLLGIGTNDVNANLDAQSWKTDLHQVIDAFQSPNHGLAIWVAPLLGEQNDTAGSLFTQYNALIPEIVAQQNVPANPVWIGPDFYSHFQSNPDQYDDWLHPNQVGYDAMGDMWSNTICNTLINPPVIPTATAVPANTETPTATATGTAEPLADTATPTATADGSNPPTSTPVPGEQTDPVAYWRLAETTGAPYIDSIGGHNGTSCTGGNCPQPVSGQIGAAQQFNGNNTGIDVPAASAFNWAADGSFTLALWTQGIAGSTCNGENQVMMGRDDDSSELHWWIGCLDDGRTHFSLNDNGGDGTGLFGPVVNDGGWHQIIAVRDGAAGMTRLYVNGVEVDSAAFSHGANFASATAPLNVGWLNLWPGYHYQGMLDDIVIYDRALGAAEIAQHYTNGVNGQSWIGDPAEPTATSIPTSTPDPAAPTATNTPTATATPVISQDPIAYWQLAEGSGAPYIDNIGGYHGTSCVGGNCPQSASGQIGGAQQFNGSNTGIDVPAAPAFNWPADTSFSLALWVQIPAGSVCAGNEVMLGRRDDGSSLFWWLGCLEGGNLHFSLSDRSGQESFLDSGSVLINDGNWHQIVAVRDATANTIRMYLDGVEIASQPVIYSSDFGSTTAPLQIGSLYKPWSESYHFQGLLDDIAVYNRALSGTEIAEHYTNGLNGQGWTSNAAAPSVTSTPTATATPPDPAAPTVTSTPTATATATGTPTATATPIILQDPAAYWRLEETGGAPYLDSIAGSHGTACVGGNCPQPVSGQIGGAQQFNGSNTGIDVPPAAAFNWAADDSFTLGFWTKGAAGSTCNGATEVMLGRDDGNTSLHWWIGCTAGGTTGFSLNDRNGDGVYLTGPAINDGGWHQIVAVRDGAAGMTRLYVNGSEVDSAAFNHGADFASATAPLNIGWLNLWPGYHYEGILDDLVIYDRALDPAEVQQQYQNGLQGQG